jgi:hypothetical protein
MSLQEHSSFGQLGLSGNDINQAKYNHQWSANGVSPINNPDKDKVWFLLYAIGTAMSLVIDGITIFTNKTTVDFHNIGLRLGNTNWVLTGVDFAYGYNIRSK